MPGRGRAYTPVHRSAQKAATQLHTTLYRVTGGRFTGRFGRNEVGLLTTTGRRTGQPRVTPLFVYADGGDFVAVASNGGTAAHPQWFANLLADSRAVLQIRERRVRVRARVLEGAERERWWERVLRDYPTYATYQAKTDRLIPLVRLEADRTPAG